MEHRLDQQEIAVLRALRAGRGSSLEKMADWLGLPRTNFGRSLSGRLPEQVSRLVQGGLVEESGGGYDLTERGRRALTESALFGSR